MESGFLHYQKNLAQYSHATPPYSFTAILNQPLYVYSPFLFTKRSLQFAVKVLASTILYFRLFHAISSLLFLREDQSYSICAHIGYYLLILFLHKSPSAWSHLVLRQHMKILDKISSTTNSTKKNDFIKICIYSSCN